ncbi:DUF4333 domain-containing protein [Prauserella muralis]|uniref:DUF4333 domain-containing protein n=1 Tax=Prauserella muralis TaxID=588067 RepID=A0A2V4BA95_9PSEU|nr:DUF4333 domain-containing protein [Prauserella muralis]PXY32217.1 hypothetical protein BAY60_07985 [Prauserella muralis]TWE24121.1 uncharacterized protein DUF4333 [Prauserella muralis]
MTQPPHQPQGWWQPPPNNGPGYPPPQTGYGQQPPMPAAHQPAPAYGGSFQSQYGGLGAFDGTTGSRPRRSRKPLLVAAGAVVLVAAAGAGAWLLGAFRGDVLEQESLQNGVATVLRDSYGEHDVSNVQCPENQAIETGHTFECTVEISGRRKAVSIRVLNDKPEYEVGAPQ